MKNKMKIRDKSNKDPKDPKLNAAAALSCALMLMAAGDRG